MKNGNKKVGCRRKRLLMSFEWCNWQWVKYYGVGRIIWPQLN